MNDGVGRKWDEPHDFKGLWPRDSSASLTDIKDPMLTNYLNT